MLLAKNPEEFVDALGTPGPSIVLVRTDRAENVAVHQTVNDAVNAAVIEIVG